MIVAPSPAVRLLPWLPSLLLLAHAAPARAAGAQRAVHGHVHVAERGGAQAKDVGNTVVYLTPAGGGAATPAPPDTVRIAMRERTFLPRVRAVRAGGAVAFPNEDPFSHNVFSNAEPGPFDLGLYRRGRSRAQRFAHPGVYAIYCNIHARMAAYVVAVATPHYAVAAPDGRFALPNVPAGSYVLHAWHERGGIVARALTVGAEGLTGVRLALDASPFVAVPHRNKFGAAYGAARADRY